MSYPKWILFVSTLFLASVGLHAAQVVEHPWAGITGITSITRSETSPRSVTMHVVQVDLIEPGIGFKLINIDPANHATIVHHDARFPDGKHTLENVTVWNAVADPAQYDATNARRAIGLSQDARSLILFTVDRADGGGSTTLAMENPATHIGAAQPGTTRPEQTGIPQNPSPMVEHTRVHPRLQKQAPEGRREKVALGTLFLPAKLKLKASTPLLVFFHGGSWLPEVAAAQDRTAVISIQIGAGSSVYAKAFVDPKVFGNLLREAEAKAGVNFKPITLAGWSAGCGAIRQIMSTAEYYDLVANTIMIDGIHTSYVGGKPGPLESQIDPGNLQIFIKLARDAMAGKKRVLITHSEIFPGTFASTTETADYILKEVGLHRRPIVKWGPMDTQELSEVRAGRLVLIGFAGNSAPDHVDQLHSLPEYLKWLKK